MIKNIGAQYLGNRKAKFCLWAPILEKVTLRIDSPCLREVTLSKDEWGYWEILLEDIDPGTRYFYHINDKNFPDPASYYQPEDVFGASCLMDHGSFAWRSTNRQGLALEQMIIYELHVGTFTPEGNFRGVISKLDYLKELGINAIEIMPIAQFSGNRNWGYDGVFPFAVQHSYGGPDEFKALVDAAHAQDIAVILDVVYNHLGPEGNVLGNFMPCFSEKYMTPWGKGINFDDRHSDGVRDFFICNALYWFEYYRVDGLRLDAIHGIYDLGAKHFLTQLSEEVDRFSIQQGRKFFLIAESDLNDVRVILPRLAGGYGMDAQWNDDVHHCIHTLLTGETQGYYADFGKITQLADAFKRGFVYAREYSQYRKRHHGSLLNDALPGQQLVVCSQNHDQVGNRPYGERLSTLVSFEALKLAASAVMFSPFIPLLFMGEEYGEEKPFFYFTGFFDQGLNEMVRQGRRKQLVGFDWKGEPVDPCGMEAFKRSQLRWETLKAPAHKTIMSFYKFIISLRKAIPALTCGSHELLEIKVMEEGRMLKLTRRKNKSEIKIFMNFDLCSNLFLWTHSGESWKLILDSSSQRWLGKGKPLPNFLNGEEQISINPLSCVCYARIL
jgi:maltooligosyltrehalose trehalohydrolase